jgi:hypothetical protein
MARTLSLFQDSIIERARLTTEAEERGAALRATFDNMSHGILMFDSQMKLAAWNRQVAALGLARRFFQPPSYRNSFVSSPSASMGPSMDAKSGASRSGQTAPHTSNARVRTAPVLEIRHNPLPEGGLVIIYSDITDRKRYGRTSQPPRSG